MIYHLVEHYTLRLVCVIEARSRDEAWHTAMLLDPKGLYRLVRT